MLYLDYFIDEYIFTLPDAPYAPISHFDGHRPEWNTRPQRVAPNIRRVTESALSGQFSFSLFNSSV